jgi:hypothetical protein
MTARVVHCKREPYDVYIGRAVPRHGLPRSKWANEQCHLARNATDTERRACIERYRTWLLSQPDLLAALPELEGKVLGCWCKPAACHGDVLVELLGDRLGMLALR